MAGNIYAPNGAVPMQGLAFGAEGATARPVSEADRLPVQLPSTPGTETRFLNPGDVFDVILSLDTSGYADGDVMADFQEVTNFFPVAGGRALIQSITVLDKDDQGVGFDILSSRTNVSLGTENSAPSISDTNAENVQRVVRVDATDYIDLGGCRIATKTSIGLLVEAAAGSTSLLLGTIIRGAGTYTASGVQLRIGVVYLG